MSTVTHLARVVSGRDSYGNDTYTETAAELTPIAVWPRGGSETTAGADLVVDELALLLPAGTVVGPTDRFTVGDDDYDVDGTAGDWTSGLTGWSPGVQVALKRVTG